MSTGYSGTYAVNATRLTTQPTTHQWEDRQSYGFDGAAHPIYASIRSYELGWQLISAVDFQELVGYYNIVQNTGTVAVDLPSWTAAGYQFSRYSGCTLSEPTFGGYFNEYLKDVRLLVYNVRT